MTRYGWRSVFIVFGSLLPMIFYSNLSKGKINHLSRLPFVFLYLEQTSGAINVVALIA
ncbi:unnamed protein product [Periconia digitata]|uniref:Uncharacterized protein n=1 Tax=Periconia digitata TaxID=1303443 RepID=A0A9W4UAP0_9PLEO|nr:unnamed protein product [Periconia digitata]